MNFPSSRTAYVIRKRLSFSTFVAGRRPTILRRLTTTAIIRGRQQHPRDDLVRRRRRSSTIPRVASTVSILIQDRLLPRETEMAIPSSKMNKFLPDSVPLFGCRRPKKRSILWQSRFERWSLTRSAGRLLPRLTNRTEFVVRCVALPW